MFSIFLVLSVLLKVSFGQEELGYNDLQDPAEWTQPGEEEDNDDPLFTAQDFSRNSPEMIKLRQNYVQALWEQILQLQKDFPSEDPDSENTMPWLWQALRDKFNTGGLPQFDFDATFPRLAGQVSPEINTKTIVEILQDMYEQSINPGETFFDDMARNLYLFNVYYDNRRKFLEDEAGRLLRHLYVQNKGCFENPDELSKNFEQPIRDAYKDHGFSEVEMHTLMFNIKHIFEGFNELKENLEVLDSIGRRILNKLHDRLQDPRKENLYRSIVKLFNKYGPALNDPKNMEGSWPRLVIDLLAAVCQTPADLISFIQNLGGLFDDNNADGSNGIDEENYPKQPGIRKKIRRKAPQLGAAFDEKSSSSMQQMAKKDQKSSAQSSSAAQNYGFGNSKATQSQQSKQSSDNSAFKAQKTSTMSAQKSTGGGNAPQSSAASHQSKSESKTFKQSKKESSQASKAVGQTGPGMGTMAAVQQSHSQQSNSESDSEGQASSASAQAQRGNAGKGSGAKQFAQQSSKSSSKMMKQAQKQASSSSSSQVGVLSADDSVLDNRQNFQKQDSKSASDSQKKMQTSQKKASLMIREGSNSDTKDNGENMFSDFGGMGDFGESKEDDDWGKDKDEVSPNFMSTSAQLVGPAGHVKGFKKRYGSEESAASSTTKRKSRRKSAKKAAKIAAYKRQLEAMQQLQAARSQMLGRKSSLLGYQNQALLGGGGGLGAQRIASESSGFESQVATEEAEKENAYQSLANRERIQALEAERTAEVSQENEDVEKNTKKSSSKNSGEEEGFEKEFEDKQSPFGTSKGKIKAYKKSSSSESSESTSSFKKNVNKQGAKVTEKIASLDKEIEELQEMLSSREKTASTNALLRGQEDRLETMSAEEADENSEIYEKYRVLLALKLKQRSQLMEQRNKINEQFAARMMSARRSLPGQQVKQRKAYRNPNLQYAPKSMSRPQLQRYPRPLAGVQNRFSSMQGKKLHPEVFYKLNNQGAPRLGLGPYTVPQQGDDVIQTKPRVMKNPGFARKSNFRLPVRRYSQDESGANEQEFGNPNAYSNPLASFRSAAGSTKGYNRKYGSEQNESSSKKKIKQKNKKKKKAQKIAANRALAESSAQKQSSQESLAAKVAQNKQYENKAKGHLMIGGAGGSQSQEALSKGAESKLAELKKYKSNLKQSQQAKVVAESVAAENQEEDEDSETEVEESTSSKSAKNYGEESGYSTDLATFHSAKGGPGGRTFGYRKQFGSADNKASAFKRVGDVTRGGEVSQHAAGYTGEVIAPGNPPLYRGRGQDLLRYNKKSPAYGQRQNLPTYGQQSTPIFGFQQLPMMTPPAQNAPLYRDPVEMQKGINGNIRFNPSLPQGGGAFQPESTPSFGFQQLPMRAPTTQNVPMFRDSSTEQQEINEEFPEKPLVVGSSQEGSFSQKGGYNRQLPNNGQEVGYQNKYGKFGTFHSAFSQPGKFGSVKGFKKKYGSETAEESSSVKKKNKNKSSKKRQKVNAQRAEAINSADVNSSREKLMSKQAKNASFKNKLNAQGGTGAVQAESSGAQGEQSMLAASKEQQNIKLQQKAQAESIESENTSEDDESETEIEENTSKKSAKNYGEESGYEGNLSDVAQFHSARSNPQARSHRGYKEDNVYLDDLVNFRNARQPKPLPLPPNMPLPHPRMLKKYPYSFMMGPSVEMSGYRKKYGSEAEERSSKQHKIERTRTKAEMAKMSASRGEMESLNEVERSSDEKMGLKTAADAYRLKPGGPGGESAGMRKRYDMYADRRDALKARLRQRAKMYSIDAEVQKKTTETEKEIEKSTHEKKEKEDGEESGYHKKFNVPQGLTPYSGLRGQSKGFNKNFSKESVEKNTSFKEKSRKKTVSLIAKITEVQRQLDMLSELQATRHQRIAASGEIESYKNTMGQSTKGQQAISGEMKEIVKQKKRLRMEMTELRRLLAIHQSESEKEIEQSSDERTSKNAGEETSYNNEYDGGNAADGNTVSGSSSGYSKATSSHSSHKTQYSNMKGFDKAANVQMSAEAIKKQEELQQELERESGKSFSQMGQMDMNGAGMPQLGQMPDMNSGLPPLGNMDMNGGMPQFGKMPDMSGGMPDMSGGMLPLGKMGMGGGMPNMNSFGYPLNANGPQPFSGFPPFGNGIAPNDVFKSINGQRLGKRDYDKPPKGIPTSPTDVADPLAGNFGKLLQQPVGLAKGNPLSTPQNFFSRSVRPPAGYRRRPFINNNRITSDVLLPRLPLNTMNSGTNNFINQQKNMFGRKVNSLGMDGAISGYHKEMNLNGGNPATNTRERNRLIGGVQRQVAVGDDDYFANKMKYAGRNTVSRSPTSSEESQELASRSEGVSANSIGFSEQKVSSSSKIFTG